MSRLERKAKETEKYKSPMMVHKSSDLSYTCTKNEIQEDLTMSIEISRESLDYTCDKCGRQLQYISDCDIIVPDSQPDVLRILEVQAVEQINDKSVSRDYINIGGYVSYNILYVGDDEENALYSIDYSAPFTQQIPAKGADDNVKCHITSHIVHTEYSLHNSRKLNVKSAVNFMAHAYSTEGISVVTYAGGEEALPCRMGNINSFNVANMAEHSFHIEEQCQVADGFEISRILRYSVETSDTELKVVVNKVVVKGNLVVKTLYLSDGEICTSVNEIPFTQIIDAESVQPDMYTTADFCIKNPEVTRELDTDATMTAFRVNADICVNVITYDERNIDYISDIYSPDYNIGVHRVDVCASELADAVSGQCIVSDSVRLDNGEIIEKVYSLSADSYADGAEVVGDGIKVSGSTNVSVLCKTDGKVGISAVNKKVPFSCVLPLSREFSGNEQRCVAGVITEHSSYSIDGADSINVRVVLKASAQLISEQTVSAVADIDCDESVRVDKSSQAGITVYFVQSGDEMWDIAKRYHTTSEEISSVNKLEPGGKLSPGQQLLIPKRN